MLVHNCLLIFVKSSTMDSCGDRLNFNLGKKNNRKEHLKTSKNTRFGREM